MSLKCSAYKCPHKEGDKTSDHEITFHRFPQDVEDKLLDIWKMATGSLSFIPNSDSALCSEHFLDSDYKLQNEARLLLPNAFPTKYRVPEKPLAIMKKESSIEKPSGSVQRKFYRFLEIHGLNPSRQSDLNSDIRRIAEFFGVEIQPIHIICSFIVKRKNNSSSDVDKTVIVKFANLAKKNELLEAFKNSENTLVDNDRSETIFITEELSAENKRLLERSDVMYPAKNKGTNKNIINTSPSKKVVYPIGKKTALTPQQASVKATGMKHAVTRNVSVSVKAASSSNKNSNETSTSSQNNQKTNNENKNICDIDDIQKLVNDLEGSDDTMSENIDGDNSSKKSNDNLMGINIDEHIEKSDDEDIESFIKHRNSEKESDEIKVTENWYNQLVSSATENLPTVSVERLDDETYKKYEPASISVKKNKPFKKRFSTDNSNSDEKDKFLQSKHKDTPIAKTTKTSKSKLRGKRSLKSEVPTPATFKRRRIIQPKKFNDEYVYYSEEFKKTPAKIKGKPVNTTKTIMKQKSEESTKITKPLAIKKTEEQKRSNTSLAKKSSLDSGKASKLRSLKTRSEKKSKRDSLSSTDSSESIENIEDEVLIKRKRSKPVISKKDDAEITTKSSTKKQLTKKLSSGDPLEIPEKVVLPTTPSIKLRKDITSTPISTLAQTNKSNILLAPKQAITSTGKVLHCFTPVTGAPYAANGNNDILPGVVPVNVSLPSTAVTLATSVQQPSAGSSVFSNNTNFKLISNFHQLIGHLKERHILESHLEQLLLRNFSDNEELFILLRCKDVGRNIVDFSEMQMKFAFVVYMYSFKCFKYLKGVFSLPSETILEKKLISSSFEPGILPDYLEYISQQVSFCKEESMNCFLVVDTVPISKAVIWDRKVNHFIGCVKFNECSSDFNIQEASSILLVMVHSINNNLSVPVAYFPVDVVYPEFLARVVQSAISTLCDVNVKIWSVIFDASDVSFSAARLLGCSFNLDNYFTTIFSHVRCKNRISVIFDSYHLRRLVRDSLADVNIIYSKSGCVEWKYIKILNDKFSSNFIDDNIRVSNSLSSLPINLCLAEALEDQKKAGDTSFACSRPTVNFIQELDKFFCMFSYPLHDFEPDSSIELSRKFFKRWFPEMSQYLRSLKINNTEVYKSCRYQFVIGLFVTLNGIGFIFDKVKSKFIKTKIDLTAYKFTLDAIDLFYHRVFKMNLSDINQINCLTFKQGLERHLKCLTLNPLAFTEVPPLLIDFRSDKRSFRPFIINRKEKADNKMPFYIDMLNNLNTKEYKDYILSLICNGIVTDIRKKIACMKCIDMLLCGDEVLLSNSNVDHIYSASDWKKEFDLIYDDHPVRGSKEVFAIIKICERVFQSMKSSINIMSVSVDSFIQTVISQIKMELVENFSRYPFSSFNHPIFEDVTYVTHETYLTSLIIESFVNLTCSKIKFYSTLF